jgi:uncharacterized protein (TIGR02246 family)
VDRDDKLAKPSPAQPSPDPPPSPDSRDPLEEIYQGFIPEMRRPKPNQEAIAAALQSMQRLTVEADSEQSVEDATLQAVSAVPVSCPTCGHRNRKGNKFCGMCGLPVEAAATPAVASSGRASADRNEASPGALLPQGKHEVHPPAGAPAGAHHYHHHYHHHYFQGGLEAPAAAPRANAPESAREADRLRVAAAAKGEPMSRGEAAVRRLTQEWMLACNTRQLDELLELYAPDAMVLRSNLPLLRGAAAVREFFFSALESGLGEVALDPIRVEVIGDVAHEVGRYSALVPGTTGKRREERGKYLWVFAKQSGGEWKLISECWSSDLTLSGAESDIPKPVPPLGKQLPRRS